MQFESSCYQAYRSFLWVEVERKIRTAWLQFQLWPTLYNIISLYNYMYCTGALHSYTTYSLCLHTLLWLCVAELACEVHVSYIIASSNFLLTIYIMHTIVWVYNAHVYTHTHTPIQCMSFCSDLCMPWNTLSIAILHLHGYELSTE